MAAEGVFRVTSDVASGIAGATKLFESIDNLTKKIDELSKKVKASTDKVSTGMKKAGEATKNAGDKAKQAKQSTDKLSQSMNLLSRSGMAVGNAMQKMGGQLMKVRDYWMAMTDSFRLVTQGITNFGRALFFFVSIPLVGFMKGMLSTAVEFEDQMVRVGKTTGLWGDELKDLTNGIRNLARNTATSHEDLAVMAEQIGQLGISSKSSIIELVDLFNMMSITTDITSDDVAKNMGKIANAFGWNLNKSTEEVTRLANVINYLENTTAASAGEIVDALYKIASVGGILDIQAQDAAAFAASLIETGMSAEESGTAVRNLFYYMSQNQDAIFNAMKSHEKYNTLTKVSTALNEDFSQVILDIADAMEGEDDNVNALVTSIEIGNLRGGKALAAFGNNFENLAKNIRNARGEWEQSTSLVLEYEKAMTSTKNQMALLQNNIKDTGITLADAFLPYVNQIIMVLVPAIRELNEWLTKLDDKTKLMIIAGIMLAIVLGPIVMFIGQIAHGVTLLMMGFGQFIKVIALTSRTIGGVIKGVSALIKFIPGVGTAFSAVGGIIARIGAFLVSSTAGWIAVIVLVAVGILKILSKMGVDVAGFFTNIADKATKWGERLMETYGNGLAKGFAYVLKVITWIANTIASFFKSASPPKAGPLKTINKWGGKLMETYLKGFYLADFDILSGVGRIIERYLTMGVKSENMGGALKKVLKARTALSQLIDLYNKTGVVDQGLLSQTTQGLGYMTEHVQKLIKLWLEYGKIQERIRQLEEKRKDVVRGYQEEVEGISASNMSLEDKVNAIRMAQFNRDSELRAIDKEKAGLEDQSAEMKDQLEWQQKFVDAMQDQDSIMEKLNNTLDKLAKGMEGMGGLGGDIGTDLEKSVQEAEDAIKGLQDRLGEGGLMWEFLKKGFTGEPVDWYNIISNFDPELAEKLREFYEIGQTLGETWDTLVEKWNTLVGYFESAKTTWGNVKTWFQGIGDSLQGFLDTITSFDTDTIKEKIKSGIASLVTAVYDTLFEFLGVGDEEKRGELAERWSKMFFDAVAIGAKLLELVGLAYTALYQSLVTVWSERLETFRTWWASVIIQPIQEAWENSLAKQLLEIGRNIIEGMWNGFKEWFDEHIGDWTTKMEEIITAIKTALGISSPSTVMEEIGVAIIQGLWDGMVKIWEDVTKWFNNLASLIPNWVKIALDIFSPSRVMEKLGEMTIKGYWIGMDNEVDNVRRVAMSVAAAPVDAMSGGALPVQPIAGVGGPTIHIEINDPVVRDQTDIDRLAKAVADKLSAALVKQQGYGGQTPW